MQLMKIRRALLSKLRSDTRGQAFVEMAIVLPIFLLLVLGMIDLARAWNAKQVITDAAREAARRGVVDYNSQVVDEAFVQGVAAAALNNAGFDASLATITAPAAGGPINTQLQVDITYPYTFDFLGRFYSGGTVQLRSRIVMRNE